MTLIYRASNVGCATQSIKEIEPKIRDKRKKFSIVRRSCDLQVGHRCKQGALRLIMARRQSKAIYERNVKREIRS